MNTSSHPLRASVGASAVLALLALVSSAGADTYTVKNTEDSGAGSLRQAILDANVNAGPDVIEFEIPSSDPNVEDIDGDGDRDVFVIRLASALPALVDDGTTIDGRTQKELTGDFNPVGPEIRLEGLEWADTGLTILSDHNQVFALNIDHCGWSAIWISGADNWIAECYLGTDPTGTEIMAGNRSIGININYGRANHNIIGTNGDGRNDDAEGNVIAGNQIGIAVGGIPWWGPDRDPSRDYSGRPQGNRIAGNLIGVDRTGTVPLGNGSTGGEHGVMLNGATQTIVGTNGDGVADEAERNIISASADSDVMIRNQQWDESDRGGDGNVIAGNYIGTDITGSVALSSRPEYPCWGVIIMMGTKFNRVEGNLISGHTTWTSPGVAILHAGSDENVVRGNYIGTSADGHRPLGNCYFGVLVSQGAQRNRIASNVISGTYGGGVGLLSLETQFNVIVDNLIGTDATGIDAVPNTAGVIIWGAQANRVERNVISGNSPYEGVSIAGARGNILSGNLIGTDVTGMAALGNGGGVYIDGASENIIGTDGDGVLDEIEGNVISANNGHGITFLHAGTEANRVAGNRIGTDVSGTRNLGNGGAGVYIIVDAAGNIIGTNGDGISDTEEGNVIAFNGFRYRAGGVFISDFAKTGLGTIRNSLRGNSIHSNIGLGIDLYPNDPPDGVTVNDPGDVDAGPNGLQNFPVLNERCLWTPGRLLISGQLDSAPGTEFVLEFFANTTADDSGHGEGQQFLGASVVRTGPGGGRQFTVSLRATELVGPYLTATATDPEGNTSEFGPAIAVRRAGHTPGN